MLRYTEKLWGNDMKTLKELFPAVVFGTSGIRALVSDLTTVAVGAYVVAFLRHLYTTGRLRTGGTVVVGTDLRPSSPDIAKSIYQSIQRLGQSIEYLGAVPTPTLALRCLQKRVPGIMVTGSHIPFDRNGIKFYTSEGEILKEDEEAISSSCISLDHIFCEDVMLELPLPSTKARTSYLERYIKCFGERALEGLRVGFYEHSAVGRDLSREILESLGATVVALGRSDGFVPIDTEAVGDDDLAAAQTWCGMYQLDALLSTDGDGDRPLVFDEKGGFVRGDILGLLCAKSLGLQCLAIPVSCNTAIEKSGVFGHILRTKIGSPHVIAGMNSFIAQGYNGVAGFEANGGFLLGTSILGMDPLPTRDAILPMITLLVSAASQGLPVSAIIKSLPGRFTHSGRIKDVPSASSMALLYELFGNMKLRHTFFNTSGTITSIDMTDGVRVVFDCGDIVHLRASGNAPELRCYAESDTLDGAVYLVKTYLELAKSRLVKLNET